MDDEGAIGAPMILVLLIVTVMAFGTWSVLRSWRHLIETQKELDHCVGTTALQLRDDLTALESLNTKVRITRQALAASTLLPEARPALQATLAVLVLKQEAIRGLWIVRQGRWATGMGCRAPNGNSSRTAPLPSLGVSRPPSDLLGPQALVWDLPARTRSWTVRAEAHPRKSAARVYPSEQGGSVGSAFAARWANTSSPGPEPLRPGLH